METRTVEQVEDWDTRSFADGFAGLRELSDGEFSGAVRAGGAWLFMLNGRIIGVYEGSLDDFENADGTAYAAPHPSLPLLFSMQEKGGETQAKYYTNDTPLSEVDSTLTDGKFTGYVELSENVLSGDYYVAYYGGRSMSVAFVGASEQVVTGDDAFERANDEVGIYEVRDVDIEVTDVPEPDESPGGASEPASGESEATGGSGATNAAGASNASGASSTSDSTGASGRSDTAEMSGAGGAGGASGTPADSGVASGRDAAAETEGESGGQPNAAGRAASAGAESAASEAPPDTPSQPDRSAAESDRSAKESDSGARAASASASDAGAAGASDAGAADANDAGAAGAAGAGAGEQTASERSANTESASAEAAVAPAEAAEPATSAEPERPESGRDDAQSDTAATDTARTDTAATDTDATDTASTETESAGSDAFEEEEQWREATTIPSLDPDRSEGPADEAVAESGQTGAAAAGESRSTDAATSEPSSPERAAGGRSADAQSETGARPASSQSASAATGASGASDQSGASDEQAQARVQKLRSQLRQRKQQVEKLKERLSNVESERNEYKRERDALRQEVERLEAKLESAGSDGSSATGRQLNRSQAFDATNLFVRYESKGEATLEEAAEGEAKPEDVNANLRLEHHTQFETDGATVEGEPFEEFLTDSFEYQFVSWVVEELLYEIRDTGHRNSLKDLYRSIPKIDRVDLHGSVGAGGDGEDTRQESFDIIMRDRMGNPLLVADLNDSRDPTTGDMMGSLVDAASGVAQTHDELSGSFQVTESFFEPKALETAENATAGGFLSREKRESFVKLSRKRGYHLCLVESRSGGFHLNVPEL